MLLGFCLGPLLPPPANSFCDVLLKELFPPARLPRLSRVAELCRQKSSRLSYNGTTTSVGLSCRGSLDTRSLCYAMPLHLQSSVPFWKLPMSIRLCTKEKLVKMVPRPFRKGPSPWLRSWVDSLHRHAAISTRTQCKMNPEYKMVCRLLLMCVCECLSGGGGGMALRLAALRPSQGRGCAPGRARSRGRASRTGGAQGGKQPEPRALTLEAQPL